MRTLILRITLVFIAIAQFVAGLLYMFFPGMLAKLLGLPETPQWSYWVFALFGARCLGYAVGMILAIRDPLKYRAWIITMIGVQAIDWIATLVYIGSGALTVAQAPLSVFMPVVFIVLLLVTMPRNGTEVPSTPISVEAAKTQRTPMRTLILRITLVVIAIAQFVAGLLYMFFPGMLAESLGLPETPQWSYWVFALFGARCLGYAVGMILAVRDPLKYRAWIITMIGVQAIDWIATLVFIGSGALTVAQAPLSVFMPVVFIVLLLVTMPRNGTETPSTPTELPAKV